MLDTLGSLRGSGQAYDLLLQYNCDPGVLRPFVGRDGRSYVTLQNGGAPRTIAWNAPATLSYDSYKFFDDIILKALHSRTKAWADLRSSGRTLNLPNGLAHTFLQYQTQGDITDATVSMRPSRRSESDRPETNTALLPIPIVHKDFDFDSRELAASRMGNMPLDTTMVELCGMKIGEALEKMTLGLTPLILGGQRVYGYLDLPERNTKADFTVPTASNLPTIMTELLALRQLLIDDNHFGPYDLYLNKQWTALLDTDFSTSKGDNTLRQRLLAIPDIRSVQILDFLPTTNWYSVMVEASPMVARAVVAVDVQTLQWETLGGTMRHYKVLAAATPHVRADSDGNSGVAVGSSATA